MEQRLSSTHATVYSKPVCDAACFRVALVFIMLSRTDESAASSQPSSCINVTGGSTEGLHRPQARSFVTPSLLTLQVSPLSAVESDEVEQ